MADLFPFNLTGPEFLRVYALFAGFVIAVATLARWLLERGGFPRTDLSDPYLLACLRGGPREAVRVSLISLLDRGLLEIQGLKLKAQDAKAVERVRRPLEKAILGECRVPEDARTVLKRSTVTDAAQSLAMHLEEDGLLPGARSRVVRYTVAFAAVALLTGVGGAKIVIGLGRDKPVSFLVVMTIVASLLALFSVLRAKRTSRGDALLGDARNLYSRLKARAATFRPGEGSVESALLAGAFGVAVLQADGWSKLRDVVGYLLPEKRARRGGASTSGFASCSSCGAHFSSWGSSCGSSGGSSCGSSCGGGGGCGGCGSS